MSLTTEITGLTSEVRQLVNTVAAQDDLVRDKIAQLAAMVPNTSRQYYVDAANGDDAADGLSPDTAFASLKRALERAPAGGICTIDLLSDVVLDVRWPLVASCTLVRGRTAAGAATMRTLTPAAEAVNRDDGWIAGLSHVTDGVLWLEYVDFVLPASAAGITRLDVITHWRGGTTVFWGSAIRAAAGADTHVIGAAHGECVVQATNTTIDASAGPGTGRLFASIAAGADPNSDWRITTNITQN